MANDEFLNPVCSPYSLDFYHVRHSLVVALKKVLPSFYGTVLDIGCGQMPYKSMILDAPSRANRYLGFDLACNEYYHRVGRANLASVARSAVLPVAPTQRLGWRNKRGSTTG